MDGKLWHEREERDKAHRCHHDRPHPPWGTVRGTLAPAGGARIAAPWHIAGTGGAARTHRACP
jgi:hypothetical protein